jgi:phosphatidate cytidylyltransferase
MNTLARRSLTAVLFGAVVITCIWASPVTFILLFLLVCGLCLWELFRLVSPGFSWPEAAGMALGLAPFVWEAGVHFFDQAWSPGVLGWLLAFSALSALVLILQPQRLFPLVAWWALGAVYIGLPFFFLLKIGFAGGVFRPELVFGLLLLTWANDTGAYLVGSQIGRRKLFPSVSPNKTWEGTLGGVAMCVLAGWGIHAIGWFETLQDGLVLGAIVGIAGTLGDLAESALKRHFQVKDTGSFLPGHGGALDRFDSFVFLLPWAGGYLLF